MRYRDVASIIVRRVDALSTTYLLVKKPRPLHAWQFPQGGMDAGETVSEAALRELGEECGTNLKVHLMDTEPQAIYTYRFPDEFIRKQSLSRKAYEGAKVAFVRADWVSGQCEPDQHEIVDYAWLTKEQIKAKTTDEYRQAFAHLLGD